MIDNEKYVNDCLSWNGWVFHPTKKESDYLIDHEPWPMVLSNPSEEEKRKGERNTNRLWKESFGVYPGFDIITKITIPETFQNESLFQVVFHHIFFSFLDAKKLYLVSRSNKKFQKVARSDDLWQAKINELKLMYVNPINYSGIEPYKQYGLILKQEKMEEKKRLLPPTTPPPIMMRCGIAPENQPKDQPCCDEFVEVIAQKLLEKFKFGYWKFESDEQRIETISNIEKIVSSISICVMKESKTDPEIESELIEQMKKIELFNKNVNWHSL